MKTSKGKDFPAWQEMVLKEILHEHCDTSKGGELVFSVSVHRGLINQIEHLGRSYAAANTEHYNVVHPGDIVYTKSPTGDFPYGIVKQSQLKVDVIVSPLYGVFRPENKFLGHWLNAYFESRINTNNYLKPLIQKGAKNTINITNQKFMMGKLRVPVDPIEQKLISEFMSSLEAKIELATKELSAAMLVKSGLMQQLFI
jgi:type I restriction enzyme, S subunit